MPTPAGPGTNQYRCNSRGRYSNTPDELGAANGREAAIFLWAALGSMGSRSLSALLAEIKLLLSSGNGNRRCWFLEFTTSW
jgi:hypothetical protein